MWHTYMVNKVKINGHALVERIPAAGSEYSVVVQGGATTQVSDGCLLVSALDLSPPVKVVVVLPRGWRDFDNQCSRSRQMYSSSKRRVPIEVSGP